MDIHIVNNMDVHKKAGMASQNTLMPIRTPPAKISVVVRSLQAEAKRQQLTPYALSKATGLSIPTVSRILSGKGSPTIATLDAIAKALGLMITVEKA